MQAGDAASGGQTVTSEEFDILSNRIGTMSALTTQTKTTVVGAVNEINQNVNNKVDRSDYDATKIPLSDTDSTSVKQALTNVDADIEKTQSGLAVIVDGDTCSVPVPADSYAYIKSNTHGLANGLYKNISGSAFPVSGGTADNTVFTPVGGGLNDLKSKYDSLNSKIVSDTIIVTDFNDVTTSGTYQARAASEAANVPNQLVPGRWYNLSVFVNAEGEITQLAYSTTYGLTYIRGRTSSGSWTSWQELALNSKLASLIITDAVSLDFSSATQATVDVPQHTGYSALCVVGFSFQGGYNPTPVTTAFLTPTRLRANVVNTTTYICTASIAYIKNT